MLLKTKTLCGEGEFVLRNNLLGNDTYPAVDDIRVAASLRLTIRSRARSRKRLPAIHPVHDLLTPLRTDCEVKRSTTRLVDLLY